MNKDTLKSFISIMRQTQGLLGIIDNHRNEPNFKLSEIHDLFEQKYKLNPKQQFFNNQYMMVSSLLSYLVLPKEVYFDSIPDIKLKDLNNKWGLNNLSPEQLKFMFLRPFLRRMRNSIVHGNIEITENLDFIFIDEDIKYNPGDKPFRAIMKAEEIQNFCQALAWWIMTEEI